MNVLHRWVSEGRQITMPDLRDISKELRKSQRYKHALEVAFCPQFSNSLLVLCHFCSNFDFSCTLLTLVISSNWWCKWVVIHDVIYLVNLKSFSCYGMSKMKMKMKMRMRMSFDLIWFVSNFSSVQEVLVVDSSSGWSSSCILFSFVWIRALEPILFKWLS